MNKKAAIAAMTVISILVVSVVFGLYLENQTRPNPTNPASEYLSFPDGRQSKIFLLSAQSSYGFWAQNDTHMDWFTDGPVIHKGDPVFIVNATVRNDYTQNDKNGIVSVVGGNSSFVVLTITLYDKSGNVVDALQAYPQVDTDYFGGSIFTVDNGNNTVGIFLSTNSRSIGHYEIFVAYASSMPPP